MLRSRSCLRRSAAMWWDAPAFLLKETPPERDDILFFGAAAALLQKEKINGSKAADGRILFGGFWYADKQDSLFASGRRFYGRRRLHKSVRNLKYATIRQHF